MITTDALVQLLGKSAAQVCAFLCAERCSFQYTNPDDAAFVSAKEIGVSFALRDARWWANQAPDSAAANVFFVLGIHLRGDGKSGYARYSGELPGGLLFGDPVQVLVGRLGQPSDSNFSKSAKPDEVYWAKYPIGPSTYVHLEFDPRDGLVLVTFMVDPDSFTLKKVQ